MKVPDIASKIAARSVKRGRRVDMRAEIDVALNNIDAAIRELQAQRAELGKLRNMHVRWHGLSQQRD